MEELSFNEKFRRRTKALALEVIASVSGLPYTDATGILRKQLIRSSTSVAANFRAVCRARSVRERYAKLCIVVEEVDETVFGIEMMEESGFLKPEEMTHCKMEAEEILKVMSSYRLKITLINNLLQPTPKKLTPHPKIAYSSPLK